MTTTSAGASPRADTAARERGLAALRQRFGDRYVDSTALREQHANQVTWLANQPPDAVIYLETTEEVAEAVRICADGGLPVIAFGAGTSLEGQVNAPHGGVSFDFDRMKRIVAVHQEDLSCTVEAGVTHRQLNTHLRDLGLFFAVDPGADATVGGMAATRASGTNAVRYGTMKDNVLSLTAVLADGTVIRTGSRATKSAAGYDLTRLMIGSEGTLGVITELVLKLHGIPEVIAGGVVQFDTVAAACQTTMEAMQTGLPMARIELLDALMVRGVNAYSKLDLEEKPTLFVEFHGSKAAVDEQSALFGEICAFNGGGAFAWSASTEERNRLWRARHDANWAGRELRPGTEGASTDVCVPISRLADIVTATQDDIRETGLIAPIVGHVGDGNFHVGLLVDMDNQQEVEAARGFVSRLNRRAIEMDGTCTGEHGVGQGKIAYLRAEHGAALDVMKAVKATLDPAGIMNPGKIFGP